LAAITRSEKKRDPVAHGVRLGSWLTKKPSNLLKPEKTTSLTQRALKGTGGKGVAARENKSAPEGRKARSKELGYLGKAGAAGGMLNEILRAYQEKEGQTKRKRIQT